MTKLDEALSDIKSLSFQGKQSVKKEIKSLFLELVGEDTFDGSVTDAAQNLYKAELRQKIESL